MTEVKTPDDIVRPSPQKYKLVKLPLAKLKRKLVVAFAFNPYRLSAQSPPLYPLTPRPMVKFLPLAFTVLLLFLKMIYSILLSAAAVKPPYLYTVTLVASVVPLVVPLG